MPFYQRGQSRRTKDHSRNFSCVFCTLLDVVSQNEMKTKHITIELEFNFKQMCTYLFLCYLLLSCDAFTFPLLLLFVVSRSICFYIFHLSDDRYFKVLCWNDVCFAVIAQLYNVYRMMVMIYAMTIQCDAIASIALSLCVH